MEVNLTPRKILLMTTGAAVLGLAVPGSQLADTKDQVSVDVELVIAVDVSYSMDIRELAVQREGYAQAIVSKEFLQALTTDPNTKLAVTYFEWSASQKIIIPWRVIDGPETADAVAREIMKTPVRQGSSTQSPARSVSRCRCSTKIPIAACGALSIFLATDLITTARITINGLPIMMENSSYSIMNIDNLDLYYEDCVIGGPGSFAVSVKRRNDFKEAIRIKLVLEVAGQTTERRIVPVVQSDPRVPCLIGEKIWQQHELAAMNQGGRTSAGAILTEPQAHVCSGSN
jgi:hypothetical protein